MKTSFTEYSESDYKKYTRLEEIDPKQSLAFYSKQRKANREFYVDVLITGVFCPIIATILAYHVFNILLWNRTVIVLLFLGFLGYTPCIILYGWHQGDISFSDESSMNNYYRKQHRTNWKTYVFMFLFLILIFQPILVGLIAVFAAFISFLPVLLLSLILRVGYNDIPPQYMIPITIIALIYSMAFWFSRARPPLFPFKEHIKGVLTDLKNSREAILGIVAEIVVGLILIGFGPMNLLYDNLYEAIIAASFSGLLLGLTLYNPKKDLVFEKINTLGEARCLIRLGKMHEARYRLSEVMDIKMDDFPEIIGDMTELLIELNSPNKKYPKDTVEMVKILLRDAEEGGSIPEHHSRIWILGIISTCAMSHPEYLDQYKPEDAAFNLKEIIPYKIHEGIRLLNTFRGHSSNILQMEWSPDGSILATGAQNGTIFLWDANKGKFTSMLRKSRKPVEKMAWSVEGDFLAALYSNKTIITWEVNKRAVSRKMKVHYKNCIGLLWIGTKLCILSSSVDRDKNKCASMVEVSSRKLLNEFCFPSSNDRIDLAVFSKNKKYLAISLRYGSVKIWDIYSGNLIHNIASIGYVDSMAFSVHNDMLAVGTFGGIYLFYFESGKSVQIYKGYTSGVLQLDFSCDGRFLAIHSFETPMHLIKCKTWETFYIIEDSMKIGFTNGLTFSPNQPEIAIRLEDNRTVQLWKLNSE